jgi:hypothetical protein
VPNNHQETCLTGTLHIETCRRPAGAGHRVAA